MIKTRFRKVLRDVMARKGRTALVSIAIFIGTAGVIALFSMSDILISQLEEDIQADEIAMYTINIGPEEAGLNLDNNLYLSQVEAVETVADAHMVAYHQVFFTDDPDKTALSDLEEGFYSGYLEPLDEIKIEPFRVVEGEFPDEPGEVAVETRTAEEFGYSVGDTIYFRVITADAGAEPTTEPRTITATVFHPYADTPRENWYGFADDASYLSGIEGVSLIQVRFDSFPDPDDEDGNDVLDATIDTIEEIVVATPYAIGFSEPPEDPENSSLVQGAQIFAQLFQTLALIALFVSGFLVVNVITAVVTEQRNQIGVMKSIGATRQDNFAMYTGIAFTYGFLGVVPAVIVGVPLGYFFATQLETTVNTLIADSLQVSIISIGIGVGLGLAVPVVFAVIPVFNATRVSILEAMTDLGIDARYGSGPIARLIGLLPIPTTVRQGLANVSIKKFRSLFTVLTLAVAVGAFVGIYGVLDSVRAGIGSYLDSFNTEMGVVPNSAQDIDEFTALLEQEFGEDVEGGFIERIEPGFFLQVEFLDEDGELYEPPLGAGGPPSIFAYGIDVFSDSPSFTYELDEGEPWSDQNADTGIVLTGSLARGLDVEVGETVVMVVPGAQREFDVVGISEYPIDQVYVDWRVLADMQQNRYIAPEDRVEGVIDNQYFSPVLLNDADTPVFALGINTQLSLALAFSEGRFMNLDASEFIVSEQMAADQNLAVGDVVTLASAEGENTTEYTVSGIFELPAQFRPLLDGFGVGGGIAMLSTRDLAALNGIELPEGTLYPQLYFVTTNLGDPTADEVQEKMDVMRERFLEIGVPTSAFNFVEFSELFTETLLNIQIILSLVALLIAAVGALGLFTTLSMSVYERQKEIGVMRSIGAGSATIATQFLTEGLVVGFVAWLLGLPLALAIQLLLFEVTGFDATFDITFPVLGAFIGLVGTMIITTVASIWPSLSAANRTVSDILRYQ